MYLKRIELNGFKSFAAKTVLDLEPGITAIVGPNGSGKSNLADAIRWVLGEQSSKQLRLKKSQEVVFAGTAKRARSGLAEVVLQLDNRDQQVALDFTDIELARRLYRSGDSDYLLNRNKVRLAEVQHLLGMAGFGPNTYSVIGQGTIDSFVLATPAERKLLFDEASGIRSYELKREQSSRKLEATQENLIRAKTVLAELEPRLAGLQRQVDAAAKRRDLEAELDSKRAQFLHNALGQTKAKIEALETKIKKLSQSATESRKELSELEIKRQRALDDQAAAEKAHQAQISHLHALQAKRDEILQELSAKRAAIQVMAGQTTSADLAQRLKKAQKQREQATSKLQTIKDALVHARKEADKTEVDLETAAKRIALAQQELNQLRRKHEGTSQADFIKHALAILKELSRRLATGEGDREQWRLLTYKAGRLLANAGEGPAAIEAVKHAQTQLTKAMTVRESYHDSFTTAVIKVRSLELDQTHLEATISQLTADIETAQKQLAAQPSPQPGDDGRSIKQLEKELKQAETALEEVRQTRAAAVDSAAVFSLASALEEARSAVQRLQVELDDAKSALGHAVKEKDRYSQLAESWFGGKVPKGDSSNNNLVELERDAELLAARLADFQSVDAELMAEYNEVKERQQFLSSQVEDLEAAQADLKTVVTQLEDLIKGKFEAAFADIDRHFRIYFQRLFGGGSAGLSFSGSDDGDLGIEIRAVPPGKRTGSLAMLSGGERALTSIALLAAILANNSSPFVVLDEVDAALDEANSARFADILAEISKKSQLLVITHNRRTMQAAHSLFGVTMDDNHVSKLLSVRLEQARELAAK